jgi:hypothetical protein
MQNAWLREIKVKVAIASTFVPFAANPYRGLVVALEEALRLEGHQTEVVLLPQVDVPDRLISQILAFRLVGLESVDRLICLRPQAHVIPHRNKVLWLLDGLLAGGEQWKFSGYPVRHSRDRGQLDAVRTSDKRCFDECKTVFVGSPILKESLLSEHAIESIVLRPPLPPPRKPENNAHSSTIICLSSYDENSRLHVIIQALACNASTLSLKVFGDRCHPSYQALLGQLINDLGLEQRVSLEFGLTSEEVLTTVFAECVAVIDLEASRTTAGDGMIRSARAARCMIVAADGGANLDGVVDGVTGVVIEPEVASVAAMLHSLQAGAIDHAALGENLHERAGQAAMSWPETLRQLLG